MHRVEPSVKASRSLRTFAKALSGDAGNSRIRTLLRQNNLVDCESLLLVLQEISVLLCREPHNVGSQDGNFGGYPQHVLAYNGIYVDYDVRDDVGLVFVRDFSLHDKSLYGAWKRNSAELLVIPDDQLIHLRVH